MDKSLPFSCPFLFPCSPSGTPSFAVGAVPNGSKLNRLLLLIGKRRRDKRLFCFGRGGISLLGGKVVDTP